MYNQDIVKEEKKCCVCECKDDNGTFLSMKDMYQEAYSEIECHHICRDCFVRGLRYINENNKLNTLFTIKEYEKTTCDLMRKISASKNNVLNKSESVSIL